MSHAHSTSPAAAARPEPGSPTARHDDARAALLEAARHVLATDGPTALTVRRIAADAGMSTMNVYSRFGGKDGVVDELFAEGFERLGAAMEAVGRTDDPLDDLRRAGSAYRAFAIEHPTSYSVMFQRAIADYEPSARAADIAQRTLRVLADLVARAMDAGILRPADPLQIAAVMWSCCHGVVSLELTAKRTPDGVVWGEVYDRMQRTVLDGLAS